MSEIEGKFRPSYSTRDLRVRLRQRTLVRNAANGKYESKVAMLQNEPMSAMAPVIGLDLVRPDYDKTMRSCCHEGHEGS